MVIKTPCMLLLWHGWRPTLTCKLQLWWVVVTPSKQASNPLFQWIISWKHFEPIGSATNFQGLKGKQTFPATHPAYSTYMQNKCGFYAFFQMHKLPNGYSQCISNLTEVEVGTEILLFVAWQVRMEWRSDRRNWSSLSSLVTLPPVLSMSSLTSSRSAWSRHQVTLGVGRPEKLCQMSLQGLFRFEVNDVIHE